MKVPYIVVFHTRLLWAPLMLLPFELNVFLFWPMQVCGSLRTLGVVANSPHVIPIVYIFSHASDCVMVILQLLALLWASLLTYFKWVPPLSHLAYSIMALHNNRLVILKITIIAHNENIMPSLSMVDENGRCNIIIFLQIVIYHENEKCNTRICYKPSFLLGEWRQYLLHCIFHFLFLCCLSIKHLKVLLWFKNGVFLLGWTWKK